MSNLILVVKSGDEWVRLIGAITVTRTVSTYTATYADGRVEPDQPCDPYEIIETINAFAVIDAVDKGVWTNDDLELRGIKQAVEFVTPEGHQNISVERFEEIDGVVYQVYDTEEVFIQNEPLSTAEKIAAMGITKEELKAFLGLE